MTMWSAKDFADPWLRKEMHRYTRCNTCRLYVDNRNAKRHMKACARKAREAKVRLRRDRTFAAREARELADIKKLRDAEWLKNHDHDVDDREADYHGSEDR